MRAAILLVLVLAGCLGLGPSRDDVARPADGPPPSGEVRLEAVVEGLGDPLLVLDAGEGRLVVVEQSGLAKIVEDGHVTGTFVDVRDRIAAGGERGFLGLALSPRFAEDGLAVVSVTDTAGDSVVWRWRATADRRALLPEPEGVVLAVDQPYANHNGGHVLFGPDGMLWYGLGDGGSAGDPQGNGQDKDVLLGKLLRLDLAETPYGIPADNPFAAGGGRPEVWAYGLRNPWRFSFDRATGDLWIGDVGQNAVEEIDREEAGARGGRNYGWNVWEGSRRFRPGDAEAAVFPVAEYTHDATGGCSVTAGHVVRDPELPSLAGAFVFADYCSGRVWRLDPDGDAWKVSTLLDTGFRVSSFGEDAAGRVYVVDHGGAVHRLVEG